MPKITRETKRNIIIAGCLVFVGYALFFLSRQSEILSGRLGHMADFYRTFIYGAIIVGWAVSVKNRVLQKQERTFLIVIACLMVFWIAARYIKYTLPGNTDFHRYLWYFYYIPILFIPTVFFLVALCVNKPEEYRTPTSQKMILIPSILFLLCVLTNDFHQLIFSFSEKPWSDMHYREELLYFVLHGWKYLLNISAFIILFRKCRVKANKKVAWIPVFFAFLILAYELGYVLDAPLVRNYLSDVTAVVCFCFLAALESCIQCRLIVSNTHYNVLMKTTAMPIRILDLAGAVVDETASFFEGEDSPRKLRLSSAQISGGSVLWQEDVTELLALTEQLNENNEELNEYNDLLKESLEQKEKKARLAQKNRLYDNLQQEIAPQIELLSTLIRKIENCEDDLSARLLLKKVVIIGAYLKRKSNLALLAGEDGYIPAGELERAFVESINILNSTHVHCSVEFGGEPKVSADLMEFYDCFERVVEACWDDMYALMVRVNQENGHALLRISVGTGADLHEIWEGAQVLRDEDGIWYVQLQSGAECEE